MQNNELVGTNQKLQKELSVLRTLAKEAIMEKKKSQTALETLKHQVVHLLGEHDMVPKQELAKKKEGARQEPPTPASTGDFCSSYSAAVLFWQTSFGLVAVSKLSVRMLAVMLPQRTKRLCCPKLAAMLLADLFWTGSVSKLFVRML